MSIGFKVVQRARAVSVEQVRAFRQIPVANISDSLNRMFAAGAALRPMHDGSGMAGPALTVKCRPGDNLMLHYALDIAAPGDVIVVDAGGDLTNALIGEMMVAYASRRELGGMVINAAIRDSASIRRGSFPIFALGVTHRGPYKDGPGEINVPIALGGMVIEPGDLIVGDDDGLIAVPFAQVDEVHAKAAAKQAAEARQLEDILRGANSRQWVIDTLRGKGCDLG